MTGRARLSSPSSIFRATAAPVGYVSFGRTAQSQTPSAPTLEIILPAAACMRVASHAPGCATESSNAAPHSARVRASPASLKSTAVTRDLGNGLLRELIDHFIEHRFLVVMLTLLAAGVGVWSLTQLPIDAVPDITNNQVQINTEAPGYSPLEAEQRITFAVETAMAGLPHLSHTRSLSRYGLSQVTVVFEEGTDIYFARQLVNEWVNANPQLRDLEAIEVLDDARHGDALAQHVLLQRHPFELDVRVLGGEVVRQLLHADHVAIVDGGDGDGLGVRCQREYAGRAHAQNERVQFHPEFLPWTKDEHLPWLWAIIHLA